MKKFLKKVMIVLYLTMAVSVVTPNVLGVTAQAAEKVKLNCTKKTINKDSSLTLKLLGTNKKVKWVSSNTDVATVSSKGVVKGIRKGEAEIIATVNDKKYVCEVTVKVNYGSVTGKVTYMYNMNGKDIANPKSPVILIPKDRSIKKADKNTLKSLNNITVDTFPTAIKKLRKLGIYATTTDSNGNFKISNVPTGKYLVYIISHETTTGGWYDAYDVNKMDVPSSYYKTIASKISKYADSDLAYRLGKITKSKAFIYKSVTVHEKKTAKVSYIFPCTYL